MRLSNTSDQFGLVAIVLHWLMAVAIIGLFAVGWYMVELTYYDALYKTLPFIHKSVGVLLAIMLLLRLVWKFSNPRPLPVNNTPRWEHRAAVLAHAMLYLLIALIVISGYLISTADGSGIAVFNWFNVPATITSIAEQEDIAGLFHEYLAYTLMGVVALHAAAALKHHFIDRDITLKRMLGIQTPSQNKPS